jgi:type IV pilus assembly protein PilA
MEESYMLERLRRRRGQEGFTLIELLVVVIIIGLLAAIAIPAFLGQRNKANDAAAKSLVRNGATAMEAYFSDGNTYVGANNTTLRLIEPNITWVASGGQAGSDEVSYGTPTATGYQLQSVSRSGTTFIYTKDMTAASGSTVRRTCSPATACPASGW